jgi:hypothetical protein
VVYCIAVLVTNSADSNNLLGAELWIGAIPCENSSSGSVTWLSRHASRDFSGLAKCLGGGWWNGSNLWQSLIRPPFNIISPDILIQFKYVLPVLGISICLLELGYVVFIWMKKTRLLWLVCILGMHIAIGVIMGMYLFALIMIVLNLAAFGADLGVPSLTRSQRDPPRRDPRFEKIVASLAPK